MTTLAHLISDDELDRLRQSVNSRIRLSDDTTRRVVNELWRKRQLERMRGPDD